MVTFPVRVWGQVYSVPPFSALNQPIKLRLSFVGSVGLGTTVPATPVIAAVAEPPWLLKVIL
jgi:hypothetical protein